MASDPQRRCLGCGASAPKAQLIRLAVRGEAVVADPSGRLEGRGAYVHDAACAREAVRRRAFGRAFRRAVTVPEDFVESVA